MLRRSSYTICAPVRGGNDCLLFNGYSLALDLVSADAAERIEADDLNRLPGKLRRYLQSRGHLTHYMPEQEREYAKTLLQHLQARELALVTATVVPTYLCNLRCTYCYEQQARHARPDLFSLVMNRDCVQPLFAAIDQLSPDTGARELVLFGGEPLQGGTVGVVPLLVRVARDRGVRVRAVTNGVELHRFQDVLGPELISQIQVTIDGPPESHDRRRVGPAGQPTFHRIADNIDLALECGVQVAVRVNVDRANAPLVRPLSKILQSRGWLDNGLFTWYCAPLLPGTSESPELALDLANLDHEIGVDEADCGLGNQGDRVVSRIARAVVNRKPRHRAGFCGAAFGYSVFDPVGDIYPCYRVIGQPEHRTGRYLPELTLDGAGSGWIERNLTEIEECLCCPYVMVCGGGCPYDALHRTGRLDRAGCCGDIPQLMERHLPEVALRALGAKGR